MDSVHMKVLHIIPNLETGGAEKLLLDSIPLYIERGLEVDLLLLKGGDAIFSQKLKELNICNIYSLGQGSVYDFRLIFKIIPFLKKYDIAHVHLFPTSYWTAIASLFSKKSCKLIYTEHSSHNKRRDKPWLKFGEKFVYSQYSKIICISEKVKENLSKWLGWQEYDSRFTVINNGINVLKFKTAIALDKKKLGVPKASKIILMTGRFNMAKDQNTLIRAFSLLENKNLYLLFVGDGSLRQESEKLVKQLNIENKVMFLDVRADVSELVKMADIGVLSSNWEGFGLVATEYMAAGKPAVVSDIDGLGDIVRGAGLLFEKGNANDLKEKLEILLNDKKYYDGVAKRCTERAKLFSIEKMVDSYIDVYEGV